MFTSAEELQALERVAELEPPLAELEGCLCNLTKALCDNDPGAIEVQATELHRSLAQAVSRFSRAARNGGVPGPLRQRLALASGQVAAQREALARATAALDRAIDVLLPEHHSQGIYGAAGTAERSARSGQLLA